MDYVGLLQEMVDSDFEIGALVGAKSETEKIVI